MVAKDKEKQRNIATKSDKRAYEAAAKRLAQVICDYLYFIFYLYFINFDNAYRACKPEIFFSRIRTILVS